MHDPISELKLGQAQAYVERYDATLLQPILRDLSRRHLPHTDFYGADVWTAYELSWLAPGGKPQVAIAEFVVPASSTHLIESKSFKYYLNSFNQTQVDSWEALRALLSRDLSAVAGAEVTVRLFELAAFDERRRAKAPEAVLLDALPLENAAFELRTDILMPVDEPFSGVWCSHLLKSNCPVTGQPDWASIWVGWQGLGLKPESLLRYLVSYRQHQDFHENCVERIFTDLLSAGQPENLWVYARYTRRGGLDINPFRSLRPMDVPVWLAPRQ
jgi:7-cyano-7-deazaguanine reductase